MKAVKYNWDNEIYLIHIEVKNNGEGRVAVSYSRVMQSSENKDEETQSIKPGERRRFLISRKSIKETSIMITYDNNVEVRVFKLLDRAYLPTDSDICKLETL